MNYNRESDVFEETQHLPSVGRSEPCVPTLPSRVQRLCSLYSSPTCANIGYRQALDFQEERADVPPICNECLHATISSGSDNDPFRWPPRFCAKVVACGPLLSLKPTSISQHFVTTKRESRTSRTDRRRAKAFVVGSSSIIHGVS
jgi:hypothetical protein